MKLVWIKIERFKRFEEPSRVDVDSRLVAVLGRNELGKTSLLEALHHLSSERGFTTTGIS